jgi:hypothetical protein
VRQTWLTYPMHLGLCEFFCARLHKWLENKRRLNREGLVEIDRGGVAQAKAGSAMPSQTWRTAVPYPRRSPAESKNCAPARYMMPNRIIWMSDVVNRFGNGMLYKIQGPEDSRPKRKDREFACRLLHQT